MPHNGVIIVHVGAGYHSQSKVSEYRKACSDALLKAVQLLRAGVEAAAVAAEAISVLEAAACTNAGRGSNLTLDGTVECDAAPRLAHPVRVALRMLEVQQRGLSLGREPPNLLVGEGAVRWAEAQSLPVSPASHLVTPEAQRRYDKYRRSLDEVDRERTADRKRPRLEAADETDSELRDTVGAVVLDCSGHIAAASSSGGIMLKHPGRVGQAAVFGCGCWADAAATTGRYGVGVSTSGTGEQLVMSCLARRVAAEISRSEHAIQGLQLGLKRGFLGSHYVPPSSQRLAGAIALRHDPGLGAVDVSWGHCTASFVLGYMAANSDSPQTLCSRLPPEGTPGATVLSQAVSIRCGPCAEHEPRDRPASGAEWAAGGADGEQGAPGL
ncbi:threonine aspartase 1-like isoform X2 [Amphibalanus amphitrite]|uniref:threonine aspartase 1-like isoform X2 n=1 Tax=Amphibalanus amphitrite TaxID=1232801 RepID=UPI001C903D52|nr:threonine aspartase 1-like isoform X2 [Amphibalanus amphitrite]XP_043195638.1 threonine aspartase 1-like isoform X2 [Amphibalanus amphitrite]XP_043220183.1 threonine aspartase 1-like isoform X2 [Amphibalanus amphitrite]